jgi:hypothetical protein
MVILLTNKELHQQTIASTAAIITRERGDNVRKLQSSPSYKSKVVENGNVWGCSDVVLFYS